ncbi:MAG: hypothetical protein KAH95_04025 [Spirochaetales bacterium]|nr:hypothetical protein [Spirochaetales bacterium]
MRDKKLIQLNTLIIVLVIIITSGCIVTTIPSEVKDPEDVTVIEENSSLFVEDGGTGITSFATNDTKYSEQFGYTLWSQEGLVSDPFINLNVTLSKLSGNDVAGYGVVFGSHDDTMLVVLINTKKEFIIGDLTGNLFTVLQSWDDAPGLKSGYNQTNIIDITYDSGTGDFNLSLNGVLVTIFRDDDAPFHTQGKNGYIVIISPMDDFPNIPVSITFKKN